MHFLCILVHAIPHYVHVFKFGSVDGGGGGGVSRDFSQPVQGSALSIGWQVYACTKWPGSTS